MDFETDWVGIGNVIGIFGFSFKDEPNFCNIWVELFLRYDTVVLEVLLKSGDEFTDNFIVAGK